MAERNWPEACSDFGEFRNISGGINSVHIHSTNWSELVAP